MWTSSPNRASETTTLGLFRSKLSPPTKLWGPGRIATPHTLGPYNAGLHLRLNFQPRRATLHGGLRILRNNPRPVAPSYDEYMYIIYLVYLVLRTVARSYLQPLIRFLQSHLITRGCPVWSPIAAETPGSTGKHKILRGFFENEPSNRKRLQLCDEGIGTSGRCNRAGGPKFVSWLDYKKQGDHSERRRARSPLTDLDKVMIEVGYYYSQK